jgi:hypothetical protein
MWVREEECGRKFRKCVGGRGVGKKKEKTGEISIMKTT